MKMATIFGTVSMLSARENWFAPRPLCLISTRVIRQRWPDNDIPWRRAHALAVRRNVERMGHWGKGVRHVREILIVSPVSTVSGHALFVLTVAQRRWPRDYRVP